MFSKIIIFYYKLNKNENRFKVDEKLHFLRQTPKHLQPYTMFILYLNQLYLEDLLPSLMFYSDFVAVLSSYIIAVKTKIWI
jgi:hypothetical protein